MKATTKRALGVGLGALLALVLLVVFVLPTRRIFFPKHYNVVSIGETSEYQDGDRMMRARIAAYPSPILYQTNGSLCGPTSLANVFRSFGEPTATATEVLLGSGKCSTGICFMGLALEDVAELAERKDGYHARVVRDLTLPAFRDQLRETAGNPRVRTIINFDRGPLFGKEGGHHSPIGGYLPDEDLVLVLDVNARYKPWLVKADRLFSAMDTVDGSTGKKRGLVIITRE